MSQDEEIQRLRLAGTDARDEIRCFDARLRQMYPEIPWDKPISMTTGRPSAELHGLGCRLCIARTDFDPKTDALFEKIEDWADHYRHVHVLAL